MTKRIIVQIAMVLCGWFVSVPATLAARGNFLNYAILTIPPKFLADIPMDHRDVMLKELSHISDDRRLDYANGYLEWYSDGGEVGASSMFYLKVLPTDSPFGVPVFVHMQKPFNGEKPVKENTYVLEMDGNGWKDITDKVFPKGVDRTSYFNPLRTSNDIEVAPWVRKGSKGGYDYGPCKMLLRWNGKTFDKVMIKPRKVSGDD